MAIRLAHLPHIVEVEFKTHHIMLQNDWIAENLDLKYSIDFSYFSMPSNHDRIEFMFKEEEDALAFKLRWT